MASDDIILMSTPEVLQSLRFMHPPEPEDLAAPIIPADNIAVSANQNQVTQSLQLFSSGLCVEIDGQHPMHLLDLVAVSTAEAGLRLHQSVTDSKNEILRGDVSDYTVELLFSANLIALKKKDGVIRLVAVGNVFHRLAVMVGCHAVSRAVSYELFQIQVGVMPSEVRSTLYAN